MSQDTERAGQIHQVIDLLTRVLRRHHRIIERLFENTGLHRSQRMMLFHLSRSENTASQKELADRFDVSPACVARTLKSLASEGYISRTGDQDDLRRNHVSITEKGLKIVNETQRTFDLADQLTFGGLNSEDLETLIALLTRVHENLRRHEDQL